MGSYLEYFKWKSSYLSYESIICKVLNMRGRGITRTFENLTMRDTIPPSEDESMASISSANPRPRSPLKSPSKMAARATSKPYDVPLPTALGPGGLVAMLKSLRQIRDVTAERGDLTKKVVNTTMDTGYSEKDATIFEDTFITCRGGGKDDNANFSMNEARRSD